MSDFSLAKLSQANAMLIEAKTVTDVNGIISIAEAARVLAKKARLGLEAVNNATELKLRAERKAGQLLQELERGQGGSGRFGAVHTIMEQTVSEYRQVLDENGIANTTSHRWQTLAQLPDDKFEEYIESEWSRGLSTSGATKIAATHIKHDERVKKAQSGRSSSIPPDITLLHGAMQNLCAEMDESSVHMIMTDPPYPGNMLTLWQDLAFAAEHVLVPGGYLFAYSGHAFLPDVMRYLDEPLKLEYVWMAAIRYTGQWYQHFAHKIMSGWKPVLIYRKIGGETNSLHWMSDLIDGAGRGDKMAHDWAQPESEASIYIEKATVENEVVLDPFMGTGSFVADAYRMNRRAVGIEIDEERYMVARDNLAKLGRINERTPQQTSDEG